jgi:hypothetical protein
MRPTGWRPKLFGRLLRRSVAVVLAGAALAAPAMAAPARWQPPPRLTWYWQLQGHLSDSHPVSAYDVDGFDTSAAEVARLHREGKRVICYIDAGTWEDWRPDARGFPRATLGRGNGWPGEKWLDIRQPMVRRLIRARVAGQCARKRFDALEADNVDEYQARSGFPITAAEQLAYNEWLARTAHALRLAVFQKNDPGQARALEPLFDGELTEQCNQYRECSAYQAYLRAGKPVLDAEYLLPTTRFCAADQRAGIMGAQYDLALDGRRFSPCWA